jgi:hypothetical protein
VEDAMNIERSRAAREAPGTKREDEP